MNAHSIAAKPVINAPLRLAFGRSGLQGPRQAERTAQNGWKTTERLPCLAAVSNFQSRSITSRRLQQQPAMTLYSRDASG